LAKINLTTGDIKELEDEEEVINNTAAVKNDRIKTTGIIFLKTFRVFFSLTGLSFSPKTILFNDHSLHAFRILINSSASSEAFPTKTPSISL